MGWAAVKEGVVFIAIADGWSHIREVIIGGGPPEADAIVMGDVEIFENVVNTMEVILVMAGTIL